jgi:hypothetical protein
LKKRNLKPEFKISTISKKEKIKIRKRGKKGKKGKKIQEKTRKIEIKTPPPKKSSIKKAKKKRRKKTEIK